MLGSKALVVDAQSTEKANPPHLKKIQETRFGDHNQYHSRVFHLKSSFFCLENLRETAVVNPLHIKPRRILLIQANDKPTSGTFCCKAALPRGPVGWHVCYAPAITLGRAATCPRGSAGSHAVNAPDSAHNLAPTRPRRPARSCSAGSPLAVLHRIGRSRL